MPHTRKLTLMVGESGSGKSTAAKELAQRTRALRLSKDDLRLELRPSWTGPKNGRAFEEHVGKVQMARAEAALKINQDVIIDDTNLNANTRGKWAKWTKHRAEFDMYRITTPLDICIQRDALRAGTAHVGRAVIERQFLMSGRLPIDLTKKIVLCDIDGTVANHKGIRSPFDESRVLLDTAFPRIIRTVNKWALTHNVWMVSGRHSTCSDDTVTWLNQNGVNFQYIFMRPGWDNQKDTVIKQAILNEILALVPQNQIECVIDDRKQVIDMWLRNKLTVNMVKDGAPCKYQDLIDF